MPAADCNPPHRSTLPAIFNSSEKSNEAVQRFNRYSDVIPFDRTRVVLYNGRVEHGGLQNHAEGRYLNASWVLERAGNKWWIASQAPVRHSSHAFLSIMLQSHLFPPNGVTLPKKSRVRTVVQLTTDIEGGRRKADPYFPSQVGQSVLISPEPGCSAHVLKVTLLASTWIDYAHCVESTVSIVPTVTPSQSDREDAKSGQDGNRETIFKHLLYTSWPDHGVPAAEDRQSLLEFMHLVDSTNRRTVQSDQSEGEDMDSDPPIIVGCSAGIGRTGSFIALSSILRKSGILPPALQPTSSSAIPASPLGPLPDGLEDDLVAVEIDCLREQRPGMVQRPEQVVLVYQSLVDVFNSSPFA